MSSIKEVIRFIIVLLVLLSINATFLGVSQLLTNKNEQIRVNNKKITIIGIIIVVFYLFMNLVSTCAKIMTDFSKDYLVQNIMFERALAAVLFVLFFIIKSAISKSRKLEIKNIFPYEVRYEEDGSAKYYIDAKYKNLGKELYKIAIIIAVVLAFGQTVFVYNNLPHFSYSAFISNYAYLLSMAIIYLIVFEMGLALDGELAPDSLEKELERIKKDRFNEMIEEFKSRFKCHLLLALDKDDEITDSQNVNKDDTIYSRVFTPIIEGRSIIIETEHLSSLNDIIPPLINLLFGTNRKILFITSDDADSQATYNWLRERNVITNNVDKVVQLFKEGETASIINDTNINICIGSVDLLLENHEIIKKCDTVFAINVDNIIANSPVNLSILAKILVEDKDKELQYIFFANAVNDLKQSIEGVFFNEDFLYYVVRSRVIRNFHSIFYAKDKGEIQHEVLPGLVKDSIGSVLPLLIPPVKYDVNHLQGFSSEEPYEDEITYLHVHVPELKTYVGNANASDIDGMIKFGANEYFTENEDSMVVTYDDSENNLVLLLNNYLKYATSRILLNVVSNKYLLRDYLIDNIDFFMQNAGMVGKIVPYQKEGKKLSLFKLINELCIIEFEEETLITELNKLVEDGFDVRTNSNPESFIKTALHCLIKEVFSEDVNIDNYLHKDLVSETVVKQKFAYKLLEDIKNQLPSDLFMQIKFEASDQQLRMLKRVPIYEVYQNYANNQYVVFNGKSYCIESIDADQGIVKLRTEAKPSTIDYRFKKDVEVNTINSVGEANIINIGGLKYDKTLLNVDAKVKYDGYYEFKHGLDFTKDFKYIRSNDKSGIKENKYLDHKCYLITFSNDKIDAMGETERLKVAETLVVLFNEVFKTLYYGANQYLIFRAAVNNGTNHSSDIYETYSPIIMEDNVNISIAKKIALIAMEDTGLEKGILDSFIIKLDTTIIPLITDYLEWVLDSTDEECKHRQIEKAIDDKYTGEVYVKSYNGERLQFSHMDKKEFLKSCGDIDNDFDLVNSLEILKTINSKSDNSISDIRKDYISKRKLVDKTVKFVKEENNLLEEDKSEDEISKDEDADKKVINENQVKGNGVKNKHQKTNNIDLDLKSEDSKSKQKTTIKEKKVEDIKVKSTNIDTSKYKFVVRDNVSKDEVVKYLSKVVFDPIINSEKDLGTLRTSIIKLKASIMKDNWNIYTVVNYIINYSNSEQGKETSKQLKALGLPTIHEYANDFITTFGVRKK